MVFVVSVVWRDVNGECIKFEKRTINHCIQMSAIKNCVHTNKILVILMTVTFIFSKQIKNFENNLILLSLRVKNVETIVKSPLFFTNVKS